jgi:hypothetical protein
MTVEVRFEFEVKPSQRYGRFTPNEKVPVPEFLESKVEVAVQS